MDRLLAIDPSLTRSGYAYTTDGGATITTGVIKPPAKWKGFARLQHIQEIVCGLYDTVEPERLSYEGYVMRGRLFPYMMERAELGGLLKMEAYTRRIPILLVPPTSLKMFATGKGNADKDMMMLHVGNEAGRTFKYDDEADAYALLKMGLASSGGRHLPRDHRHYKRKALSGCSLDTCVD